MDDFEHMTQLYCRTLNCSRLSHISSSEVAQLLNTSQKFLLLAGNKNLS